MKMDDRIKARLADLVKLGEKMLLVHDEEGTGVEHFGILARVEAEWEARARSAMESVFGRDSVYWTSFVAALLNEEGNPHYRQHAAHGVVVAAQADYVSGYLFKVRQLVEAEVFDDFLEQATQLLGAGYRGPATVVAGCVLEDALRKLCIRHVIALPVKPKFDDMNQGLRAKKAYDQSTWRMVTAYADLRNLAAHEPQKWDAITEQKVADMIHFVRKFLNDYCS